MASELEQGMVLLRHAQVRAMEGAARSTGSVHTFYCRLGKRVFDTIAAAVGLVAASPLFLICAMAIRIDSFGPIFFRQQRIGQWGRPFDIVKFRTMVHQAEKAGLRLTAHGDPRITAVGKWLRKLKLDELPQLLNVLKGDMSLVGPRAKVAEYVGDQLRVLEVKPGITGPASLAFINEEKILAVQPDKEAFYFHTLMPRKLELDLSYCRRVTFFNDLRMILSTLRMLVDSRSMEPNKSVLSAHTVSLVKRAELSNRARRPEVQGLPRRISRPFPAAPHGAGKIAQKH